MKKKLKCWYYIIISECVLCGSRDVYKERRYTKKPKLEDKRYNYRQDACSIHFL